MGYFPSFSEGLSLRPPGVAGPLTFPHKFPFLFGGTFIEAKPPPEDVLQDAGFPFLFGGTFIEAKSHPMLDR